MAAIAATNKPLDGVSRAQAAPKVELDRLLMPGRLVRQGNLLVLQAFSND